MDVRRLAEDLRNFDGLKRKKGIGELTRAMGLTFGEGGVGDDAAVIDTGGDEVLLFSADSILQGLVDADPFFAGYSAVLVNVNDIAAMGGTATAMVNVLSAKDRETGLEIAKGVWSGSAKFGVPVVGGHFNPEAACNGIAISIIGRAKKGSLIRSDAAEPGENIVVAVDLDGRLHPRYPLAWDSTTGKSSKKVRDNLGILVELGRKGLVRSGRDISNPGVIGTIAMLLEGSGCGGAVEVERIPRPDDVEPSRWLKVYPGFGFVLTVDDAALGDCLEAFKGRGIEAAAVGRTTGSSKLLITHRGDEEVVFDFERDSVFGD